MAYHAGTYLDPLLPCDGDKSAQLNFYVIQEAWMPGIDLLSTTVYLLWNELIVIPEILNLLNHFLEACVIDL
jgi:hypothetical protein